MDLISRQDALDAFGAVDDAFLSVAVIKARIKALPSVQQDEESCDTCKHGRFGSVECNVCRVGFPSKYERDKQDEQSKA